jgi:hypothetical protein
MKQTIIILLLVGLLWVAVYSSPDLRHQVFGSSQEDRDESRRQLDLAMARAIGGDTHQKPPKHVDKKH